MTTMTKEAGHAISAIANRGAPAEDDGNGGHTAAASGQLEAAPSLILLIRERHRMRVATIDAQKRINSQALALVRQYLGYDPTLDVKARNKIVADATAIVAHVEKGKPLDDSLAPVASAVAPFIMAAQVGRQPLDALRKKLEKDMVEFARQLPVWPWCESVRGFGEVGLCTIIGEAGDIGGYATHSKLWKRMGVAVINGQAQGRRKKAADGDISEALEHGYNPKRRSRLFTIGDSLIKGNGDGEYRRIYLERKEYESDRVKTKMHAHRRAQRYMEKRLLRDLWKAWRASRTV